MGLELQRRARAGARRDRPADPLRGRPGAADQRPRERAPADPLGLLAPTQELFESDREARYRGEAPAMIPVVAEDPLAASVLPTPDSWRWFTSTGESRAPAWRNEVTLRSVEMFLEYEPGVYVPWISPTPLLMVVAAQDHLTVADLALEAYERAREPKALELLPGGHFDAYVADFDRSAAAASDWFRRHL